MKISPKIVFLIGFMAGCAVCIYSFFQYPIDTISMIFIPLLTLMFAVSIGIMGYCITYIMNSIFIEHRYFNIKLIILLLVIWPAFQIVTTTWQVISPAINHLSVATLSMNSNELDKTVDQIINKPNSLFTDKKYELGLVLRNPQMSAATLAKIVNLNNNQFYQPMSTGYNILYEEKDDTSLMTLIVNHPNVTQEILATIYLKASPQLKDNIAEKMKLYKQNAKVKHDK